MNRIHRIEHCFAHSRDPIADPLLHAAMIEGLLWRDLSGLRQVSGDTAKYGLLDGWLAELREAMLRDADSIDREYRLKVLEIAAKRLRERIQVVRPQPGTEAG